jgi:hypothetical protein
MRLTYVISLTFNVSCAYLWDPLVMTYEGYCISLSYKIIFFPKTKKNIEKRKENEYVFPRGRLSPLHLPIPSLIFH